MAQHSGKCSIMPGMSEWVCAQAKPRTRMLGGVGLRQEVSSGLNTESPSVKLSSEAHRGEVSPRSAVSPGIAQR